MKKTISRNQLRLILLKEAKKEILLERKKKVLYSNFANLILIENKNLLNSKYLLTNEINEGIFDSIASMGEGLLGNLLPGFIGQMKQRIVTEMMGSMGINTNSKFALALINIFEELEWTQLLSYFKNWDSTGCKGFVSAIVRGLQDFLQESLAETFGLELEAQSNVGGTFRETITTTVNDNLSPFLEESISNFVCNIPVGNVLSKIKAVAVGDMTVEEVFSEPLANAKKRFTKTNSTEKEITNNSAADQLAKQFGE